MQKLKQSCDEGIGQNLKRLRKSKKLTQIDVVRELEFFGFEISRTTYNKMEHNNYSIRIKELMALKLIFDCEFSEFFENLEYPERLI